ncbi:C40 family peptidase [Actinoplanes sp. CA-131856]
MTAGALALAVISPALDPAEHAAEATPPAEHAGSDQTAAAFAETEAARAAASERASRTHERTYQRRTAGERRLAATPLALHTLAGGTPLPEMSPEAYEEVRHEAVRTAVALTVADEREALRGPAAEAAAEAREVLRHGPEPLRDTRSEGGSLAPLSGGGSLAPLSGGGSLAPLSGGGGLAPLSRGGGLAPREGSRGQGLAALFGGAELLRGMAKEAADREAAIRKAAVRKAALRIAAARKAAAKAAARAERKARAEREARETARERSHKRAVRVRAVTRAVITRHSTARRAQRVVPLGGGMTAVIAFARSQVGKRYVHGGTGPFGFDCSGFTKRAYALAGIHLPHSSGAQAARARSISTGEARPGDLVVGPGHVGIYMGRGMMIDAGNSRTGVVYRKLYSGLHVERLK